MKKRKPIVRQVKPPVEHDRRIPLGLEEIYSEAEGRPYSCFINLTREMADDWTTNHLDFVKQRPLSEDNITVLRRLHEEELYSDYKSDVVFDTHRDMRNGMHVTTTLARGLPAGLPTSDGFIINVRINLPVSLCDDWDQIKVRSAADQLKIHGYTEKNRFALSRAAKVLWQYQHHVYDGMGYLYDRSPGKIATGSESTRTVDLNPDLKESIFQINKCFDGRQFSRAAMHAAYCVLRRIDLKGGRPLCPLFQ